MTPMRTALVAVALAAAGAVPSPALSAPVALVASTATTPAPPVVAPAVVVPPVTPASSALFRTPEAAMRYLVNAYNHHDTARLKRVTTPDARTALEDMRAGATDLRLKACTFRPEAGDYECTFSHGFPASLHRTDRGFASFTVAPAARPGWYMTVLETCGG